MQEFITFLILGLALFYTLFKCVSFFKASKKENSLTCSKSDECGHCSLKAKINRLD